MYGVISPTPNNQIFNYHCALQWSHNEHAIASQITGVSIVYSTVCSGADQRKQQSSASLSFVRGIHRWPVNSRYKGPVTRKMFPIDDVIMGCHCCDSIHRQIDRLFNNLLWPETKKISKVGITGPFWAESRANQWIPVTKGQYCGKCFHAVMSSWNETNAHIFNSQR